MTADLRRWMTLCERFQTLGEADDYLDRAKTFLDHWPMIRRQCSEILKLYRTTHGLLLRGIRGDPPPIFRTSNVNRMPEENERREEVDAWLTAHGFKALRGNSVFCSNSITQMFKYGEPYIILPINGFHYTWYRDTYDLYQLNFNNTVVRDRKLIVLPIEELMARAEPTHTDIAAMLGTNRDHELHFTGTYWALHRRAFGQILLDVLNNGRYLIPKIKQAIAGKYPHV